MSHEPIDAAELDRLVREHLPAAVRFATRLTGRTETAEDIVQEALLRVARKYRSFRGEASFRTWLFRIIVNVVRDRPKRHREQPYEDSEVPDTTAARLSAEALSHLIARYVSRLPPRQREVIVLTVYEELSIPETAKLLDMTEQNVHATLHVARRRLRAELSDQLLEKS
jgi:RNA polymerase sigma-70 factor (ECF subfamily)